MHEAAIGHPQATVPIARPAPVAPWLAPPDVAEPLLPHKDIMSNFPTLRAG